MRKTERYCKIEKKKIVVTWFNDFLERFSRKWAKNFKLGLSKTLGKAILKLPGKMKYWFWNVEI